MEVQLKRISNTCQDICGHDLAIVRSEQKCALVEDQKSFEMQKMMVRTNQLLHTTEATGSKVYPQESEVKTEGRTIKLVLSLKQFHTQFYCFYDKGSTRAMVCLQGLHLSDMFQCSNVVTSLGLKSYCPWCFKLGGNMETIATHLREVHY